MRFRLKWFIISLLYLEKVGQAFTVRKFVYQKDMSEHCRRRVVPSVFLGREISEAHSQILHFSGMELPYSCFISVRAESGSNIILVVQLLSERSLTDACSTSSNQLLVYEMGETFGGYWGPMPEVMMTPTPDLEMPEKMYTVKATEYQPFTWSTRPQTTRRIITRTRPSTYHDESEVPGDFIRMEVPIVNVSGGILHSDDAMQFIDADKSFDMLYDVIPKANQNYESSMLPMVQFSLDKGVNSYHGSEQRFGIDYDIDMFTSGKRLPLILEKKKNNPKQNFKNRMLKFRKNTSPRRNMNGRRTYFTKSSKKMTTHFSNVGNVEMSRSHKEVKISTAVFKNWDQIEKEVKKLKENSTYDNETEIDSTRIKNILEAIKNLNYNYSAYLHPNLESFSDMVKNKVTTTVRRSFGLFTKKVLPQITFPALFRALKLTKFFNITTNVIFGAKTLMYSNESEPTTEIYSKDTVATTIYTQSQIADSGQTTQISTITTVPELDKFSKPSEFSATKRSTLSLGSPVTGSMVGRESWENVVQAAPVMAGLLNQTAVDQIVTNTALQENGTMTVLRKKRLIQSIPIEIARPHNLTTREGTATPSVHTFQVSDMHDFVHLVELQDDELHDRVALRYLRQYVGSTLFNICSYNEPKTRHVFLINSSRIAIAISNFTLPRMTMILTPARTLMSGGAKCSRSSLECQVYGTRVCIDDSNACDGVPNCGAYEVYDEDRLMCGVAVQHNVYLAAMAFIAVLLTLLYTVHYWLKQCVPNVSEAFFVYTDGAENILYLESIMRSPFDTDSDSKDMFHGNSFENYNMYNADKNKKRGNIFYRTWKAFNDCITCKYKQSRNLSLDIDTKEEFKNIKRKYSFAELELKKICTKNADAVDVCVQTGDSLDAGYSKPKRVIVSSDELLPKYKKKYAKHLMQNRFSISSEDTVQKYVDELSVLKFFKDSKSDSLQSYESHFLSIESGKRYSVDEEELQTHSYDRHNSRRKRPDILSPPKPREISLTSDDNTEHPVTTKGQSKHLRFEEEILEIKNDSADTKKSAPDRKDKWRKRFQTNDGRHNMESSGSTRDFKSFFSTKKSKKKTKLALN